MNKSSDQFSFDDLFAASVARDEGMLIASENAERSSPGWKDIAYSFLVEFARKNREFISEDVSDATKTIEFPQPPTDRAWGSVYQRALKNGVIKHAGIGRSRRRHASICPLWASTIFQVEP